MICQCIGALISTGDLMYTRRWEEPPIKLTPPYSETAASEQLSSHKHATMQLCNVQVHEEVFIGLLGGRTYSEDHFTNIHENNLLDIRHFIHIYP